MTIVWFGMTWSLELYSQTNARLWRQGQISDTVVVMHIITAGTIDEDILKALQRKDKTQSALIAAVKSQSVTIYENPCRSEKYKKFGGTEYEPFLKNWRMP